MNKSYIPGCLLCIILLITMSISGVFASFIYSEENVSDSSGNISIILGSFSYKTGNGSFSSKEELIAYLTNPENSTEVSKKYFDNTLKINANEDGSIKLSTPSKTQSVLFTAEFVYELQQVGVTTILINDFTISGILGNFGEAWEFSYYDYEGNSQRQQTQKNWQINISSPITRVENDDGSVSYITKDGNPAQDIKLATDRLSTSWSWNMGSVTFE